MSRVSLSNKNLFLWYCTQVDSDGDTVRNFWVVANDISNAEAAAREVIEEYDDAPVGGFDWEVQLRKLQAVAAVNVRLTCTMTNVGALPEWGGK